MKERQTACRHHANPQRPIVPLGCVLTSIYNDLEKLVKSVDMRRLDSVPLRVLSTIYDEAAGLPASNSPVDEESYRECVEAAAVYQEFAQAYFDSTQRQEVARALRNMSHLGNDRLRAVPVEKMHAQFLAVLRALKANEQRLIDMHKWRVSAVIEMPFLETVIEVEFGRLRDERFVAQLKAALLIRQGELVSVSLGSPRETLWAKVTFFFFGKCRLGSSVDRVVTCQRNNHLQFHIGRKCTMIAILH
ncbi:hypothetical protein Aduo_014436 [Ancylostoma duodenale]